MGYVTGSKPVQRYTPFMLKDSGRRSLGEMVKKAGGYSFLKLIPSIGREAGSHSKNPSKNLKVYFPKDILPLGNQAQR